MQAGWVGNRGGGFTDMKTENRQALFRRSLPDVRSILEARCNPVSSAALTSKGQITIPVEVRRKMGVKTGDRLLFIEGENGEFILKPKTGAIMDLDGIGNWDGPPVTI